jgi:hypothetical protein
VLPCCNLKQAANYPLGRPARRKDATNEIMKPTEIFELIQTDKSNYVYLNFFEQ